MHHTVKPQLLGAFAALLSLMPVTGAWAADYTVSTTTDRASGACNVGDCSLREAIIAVNGSADITNTITLPAGNYTLTLAGVGEDSGATGDLDITNHVTITGAGEGVTIIDANSLDRVLHVHSANNVDNVTVTISGLTLQNGAVDAANGGCLNIDSFSTVELTDVTITSCTTTNAGQIAGQAVGGGIYNAGTLTMIGGTIGNSTANVNQAISGTIGGGGLFNDSEATAALRGVTINSNSAINGGEFVSGGGVLNLGTLTIREDSRSDTGSTIGGADRTFANSAWAGAGISNIGGIIAITNSTIRNNETTDEGLGNAGGGIYNVSAGVNRGNAIITASTISDNYSGALAGGLFSNGVPLDISHTTISNNQARYTGGGLFVQGNTPSDITNSTIAFNFVRDDLTNSTDTRGGGLHVTGRANINSTTIAGNYALTGQQINVQNNATSSSGTRPQVIITNSIVAHDSVVLGAGLESTADNNCAQGNLQDDDSVTPIDPPVAGQPETFENSYILSRDFNLDSGSTCAFEAPEAFSDLINADPQFVAGGLQDNGGPTETLAIDAASQAVDRRALAGCPSRDQRYYVRNVLCDNGAYEADAVPSAQNLVDVKLSIDESADPIGVGEDSQLVYTLTVTNISRDDSLPYSITDGVISGDGSLLETPRVVVGSGSCTALASSFTCNLGSLAGLSTTKISVTVIPSQVGTISISAQAYPTSADEANLATDPFHGNNEASETTEVSATADDPSIQGSFGSGGGALGWATLLLLALVPALRRCCGTGSFRD